jgi:hypothetical protein
MLFELGGSPVEAPLHVDEGIGAAAVGRAPITTLGLASVVTPALGLIAKLTQSNPHAHQLLTCHAGEYIASPKGGEGNY